MTAPNLFNLSGHHLSITYTTTGIDGKPHLGYHDSQRTLSFSGDEITIEPDSPLGTLVTVFLLRTVDAGSTTFTLLVPRINVAPPGSEVTVHTDGITTIHRFSIVPALNRGQLDSYTVTRLSGSARVVEF